MLDLEIKKIDSSYAEQISNLLMVSSKDYNKYFIPFSFELDSVKNILSNFINDYLFGIFISNELVGFYMLRGFDEGFEIPSYGVFINEKYSGKGLGKLSLDHAISLSKLLNRKRIMLKVHPENLVAKNLYFKFGFKQEGFDPTNANLILFKDI